jgi:hypothetical protein
MPSRHRSVAPDSAFRATPARTERHDRTTTFRHGVMAQHGTSACADVTPSGHSVRSRISEDFRSYNPHRSVFEATVRACGCEAGDAARVGGVAFIVTGILLISLGSPRA